MLSFFLVQKLALNVGVGLGRNDGKTGHNSIPWRFTSDFYFKSFVFILCLFCLTSAIFMKQAVAVILGFEGI